MEYKKFKGKEGERDETSKKDYSICSSGCNGVF